MGRSGLSDLDILFDELILTTYVVGIGVNL